jgi:hypothetical protein
MVSRMRTPADPPRLNRFAFAIYVVAGMMIVLPPVRTIIDLLPLQMGVASWRFGATGLVINSLLLPTAGMLIMLFAAVALRQDVMRRLAMVVTVLLVTVLMATVPLFILDALQLRAAVNPEFVGGFDTVVFAALGALLLSIVALIGGVVGAGGRTSVAKAHPGGDASQRDDVATPLVMGAEARRAREAASGPAAQASAH